MALAALTETLRRDLAAAATEVVSSNHAQTAQALVDSSSGVSEENDWEEATLHEAIENDRRITTRNIIRWLDQILSCIINCHRAYISVGHFTAMDVKIGNRATLSSAMSYADAFTAWLKLENDAINCKYDTGDPSLSSKMANSDNERIAMLDFHRRVHLHQQTFGRKLSQKEICMDQNSRLPKGFECQKMARFDFRHDNNITIAKENGFHSRLVSAYKDYCKNIWQDLRCLGIIILQIYTLSVFRSDECEKLMHWHVPADHKDDDDEETEREDDAPARAALGATVEAGGRRRSSVTNAGAASSEAQQQINRSGTASKLKGNNSKSDLAPLNTNISAKSNSRNSTPKQQVQPLERTPTGRGGSRSITPTAAAGGGIRSASCRSLGGGGLPSRAPSTIAPTPSSEATLKKRMPRVTRRPGPLELSLSATYPCIARMPVEVKDLLLTVCFTRAQDACVEKDVKHRGEDCTRLECPLLPMLKEARAELHELADKLDSDCHYVAPNLWTAADERARVAAIRERKERMALQAQQGPQNAVQRLKHERYLLWYSMQSDEFKEKLEARKKARKKAQRNSTMRKKYIYQASFHRWTMVNFSAWVHEALIEYCNMILDIRSTVAIEKKKLKKNPAVYINRLINDLLMVFTKTAVSKITAYKEKRTQEDPVGWERAIHFDRPSTCGGSKVIKARQELQSAGLLIAPGEIGGGGDVVVVGEVGHESNLDCIDPFADPKQHQANNTASTTSTAALVQSSLPHIKPHSPNSRRSKSAGTKDKAVDVKHPSQHDIFLECFTIVAAHMTKLILKKERNPFILCRNMRNAIKSQEKEESEALIERVLITSEEQLYYKRLGMQSAYFTASTKQLRNNVIDFSDLIDLLDRGWVKYVVHLISSAIMHHYHKYAPSRIKGENYATDRIIAFFRGIVVRNIVSRVWQRTGLSMSSIASPGMSSKGASARNSPSSSFHKHMGGGVGSRSRSRSGDTHDRLKNGIAVQRGLKHSPQSPAQSVAPSVRSRKRVNTERRKPLCFRTVESPTARSILVDLNVSIESDENVSLESATQKEIERLIQRYDVWKRVVCVAYIETKLSDEPVEVSSHQVFSDSGVFVAAGHSTESQNPASPKHSNINSSSSSNVKKIDNPIKRRLVIRFSSHTNKNLFGTEEPDSSIKKYPVKVDLNISDGIPDDGIVKREDFLSGLRSRAQSLAEEAWDDRSIESLSLAGTGVRYNSSFPLRKEEPKPSAHTVVSYRICLEDVLAYSCYNIQIEFDRTLADDLKEGNKSFFRFIALADEKDDISVDSADSLHYTRFAEVGKQWGLAVEEAIEMRSDDSKSIEAFPELEVMTVQLEQYVYTRPGVPRTVKDLTGRVAYSSTDLLSVSRRTSQSPSHNERSSCSTSAVQFRAVYQPDGSALAERDSTTTTNSNSNNKNKNNNNSNNNSHYTRNNSLDPAAHFTINEQITDAVHGCVLLHWRHSLEDSHTNTHYEVQRRLLLISSEPPAKLKSSEEVSGVINKPKSCEFKHRDRVQEKLDAASRAELPSSTEEVVYIGPWAHVAGLKTETGRKSSAVRNGSSKKQSSTAAERLSLQPIWSFPLHANSCTDKISLPDELNSNPDAYNSVMGYLCACFPDLVMKAAAATSCSARGGGGGGDGCVSALPGLSEDSYSFDTGSAAGSVSDKEALTRVNMHESVPIDRTHSNHLNASQVLQCTVPSNLRISYEYRVRAVNSAGAGKFNSTSSATPLQYMLKDGRQPIKMCVVPVAVVCCYVAAVRDFRVNHPKYRSLNTALLTGVLAQREHDLRMINNNDVFIVEPSGDPFVQQLVSARDSSLAAGASKDDKYSTAAAESETRVVQPQQQQEDPEISAWLRSLQMDCPL